MLFFMRAHFFPPFFWTYMSFPHLSIKNVKCLFRSPCNHQLNRTSSVTILPLTPQNLMWSYSWTGCVWTTTKFRTIQTISEATTPWWSVRIRREPIYLQEHNCMLATYSNYPPLELYGARYPLLSSLSYQKLSSSYRSCILSFSSTSELPSYQEAIGNPVARGHESWTQSLGRK